MNWIHIGFRNLKKNRRRSLFTITAIALGFAAINLFGGFTHYVYKGLEEGYVYARGNGHLSIFRQGFLTDGALDPRSYLLSEDEVNRIVGECAADSRILLTTPQLNINGLVSNGKVSTIMIAEGRVPSDLQRMHELAGGFIREVQMFDGPPLGDGADGGVGMTRKLASKLHLSLGSDAIVVATTVDGYTNALDARLVQNIEAPWDVLDGMMMTVPLAFAQKLYTTARIDRLNVLLAEPQTTWQMREELQGRLLAAGLNVEVHTWDELQPSYAKTRDMFDVIFLIAFIIGMVIVIMSIVNTVSTAVMERTRETGTLRAIGLRRQGVVAMFVIESVLLGAIGSLGGILVTIAGWLAVLLARPTWIPPHIPRRVPLEIHLVPEYLGWTLLCMVLLAGIAAAIPARRAANMAIIDALGHI